MTQPPTPRSRLSIAVIGAGGIGSAFAYQLARAGHEITVVARPGSARLQQLQRDGGIVTVKGERVALRAADRLSETEANDLVVVTTLAHQVAAVVPDLQRSRARSIQLMFNTFDPRRLRDEVGAGRCGFGMPFIMARLDGQGRLDATIPPNRKTLHGDRRWAELFQEAALPSTFEPDMPLWLRSHAPLCVAMESISAAGHSRGGGASWAEAARVARGLRAGFEIIKGLGEPLHASKRTLANTPTPALAAMLWGVSRIRSFRDLLATGANECRAIADAMAVAARGAQPPMTEASEAVLAMKPD